MRINHVIKNDQWRAAHKIRPAPHFVVSLLDLSYDCCIVRGPTILRPQPWGNCRLHFLTACSMLISKLREVQSGLAAFSRKKTNLYKTNTATFQVEKQMNFRFGIYFRLKFKYVNKLEVRPDLSS